VGFGFHFVEPEWVSLRDLSAAFYDLSVLYDITALVSVPEGREVKLQGALLLDEERATGSAGAERLCLPRALRIPLLLELGLLPSIFLAPAIIRRWTAAIEDVLDLPDRIRDRRGKRREARQERDLRAAERDARLKDLELADDLGELLRRDVELRKIEQDRQLRVAQSGLIAAQQALNQALADPSQARRELNGALEEHEASGAYANVKRRLEESPVRVYEVEIFDWEQRPPASEGEGGRRLNH
jgi:hypothetical protein